MAFKLLYFSTHTTNLYSVFFFLFEILDMCLNIYFLLELPLKCYIGTCTKDIIVSMKAKNKTDKS